MQHTLLRQIYTAKQIMQVLKFYYAVLKSEFFRIWFISFSYTGVYLLCEKCHILKRQIEEQNTVCYCVLDTKEQRVQVEKSLLWVPFFIEGGWIGRYYTPVYKNE